MYNDLMNNRELSSTFRLVADLLEIKGENIYKILAYRRAAESLANLDRDIEEVWQAGELEQIPGIGKAIAEKIDELQQTGRLGFLDRLTQEVPLGLADLLRIPDVGPKKAALFWRQAGITNLAELEAAARAGKLQSLPGVGQKSEARILAGIEAYSRRSTRTPLGEALPFARQLVVWLRGLPPVQSAELAGSLRRMRPTIGDIDLVAASQDPESVMKAFTEHPRVRHVSARGETKSSVEFQNGLHAQLWVYAPERYGTGLIHTTGSKEHAVHLREMAQKRGLSLSDRSILNPDGSEQLFASEEDLYAAFGMAWVPPELREDRGEIQAALTGKLPHLVTQADLTAELHTHSTWSDGRLSIREMAEAARQRGLKAIAITDHSASLGVAGGLSPDELAAQRREILAAQDYFGDTIRLFQGAEVEILADGSLDYRDDDLAKLDMVIASLHSGLRQPRQQVTDRLVRAMRNPHVDVIGHPSGRLIPDREGADLDMEVVLDTAAQTGVALEINAHPARLDLDDIYARRAASIGIPISLNTDAHHTSEFENIEYGLGSARRAWLEPHHIINTWPVDRLAAWLFDRQKSPPPGRP
jgi:DNA polymerase (family 10)